MVESESNRALTEAIILMAKKLGIKTIAEGVETNEQRAWLFRFSCDYMQGYLYSTSVKVDEFM
jgi:EAL domain-containing protein (putative c-di-GMP-specific phosphodiesterase class I)